MRLYYKSGGFLQPNIHCEHEIHYTKYRLEMGAELVGDISNSVFNMSLIAT